MDPSLHQSSHPSASNLDTAGPQAIDSVDDDAIVFAPGGEESFEQNRSQWNIPDDEGSDGESEVVEEEESDGLEFLDFEVFEEELSAWD